MEAAAHQVQDTAPHREAKAKQERIRQASQVRGDGGSSTTTGMEQTAEEVIDHRLRHPCQRLPAYEILERHPRRLVLPGRGRTETQDRIRHYLRREGTEEAQSEKIHA